MKLRLWAADTFRFSVQGPEIHRFLNQSAAAGVRLRRVRWQKDGCSAAADGIDRRRLEKIAADGGWVITVTARRGPGRRAEVLLQTRPGLVAGMILFLVLLKFLGGFVWCVDFGAMHADLQPMMRQLLADCAIHEGTRLTKPLLQAAQAEALRRILPLLSEEECAVFKRGRNAHMGTIPKHAQIADYRAATGLEALFGYLYLSGADARLAELMRMALGCAADAGPLPLQEEGGPHA